MPGSEHHGERAAGSVSTFLPLPKSPPLQSLSAISSRHADAPKLLPCFSPRLKSTYIGTRPAIDTLVPPDHLPDVSALYKYSVAYDREMAAFHRLWLAFIWTPPCNVAQKHLDWSPRAARPAGAIATLAAARRRIDV